MLKARTRCLALFLCLMTLFSCIASASAVESPGESAEPETQTETPEASERKVESETILEPDSTDEPASTDVLSREETSPEKESSPEEEPGEEPEDYGIMPLADTSYTFISILTASQTTSANNYLNYTGGSGTHAVPIHQVKFDGGTYWAYCADNRKDWPGSSYSNYTQASLPTTGLYQVQKVAMQLGFGDNNVTRLKQLFGYDLNTYEAYQATQVVMWAAQVWEEQWSYLGSAPATIRAGVTNYWKAATPSGKSANALNFALALADAVQAVYESGTACSMSTTTDSETTTYVRYLLTVKTTNYYGGYTLTLSGLPSGTTVSTSDSDISSASTSGYTSTQVTGSDTLYITVPKTASSRTFTLTAKAIPYVQQYTTDSAVGYLKSASSTYQDILYSGGELSVISVTGSVSRTVPALPNASITITKLDAQTGEVVPGVVFALYEYNGSAYADTGITATTNSKGVATFTNLQYSATNTGLYRVYEKSSETHQVWTDPYVAWVSLSTGKWYAYSSSTASRTTGVAAKNSSGSYTFTFSFTAYNEPLVKTGSLTIRKQDGGGTAMSGAVFVLTDASGASLLFSKGSDGAYIPSASGSAQLTTDSRGQIQVNELPFGTYLVTEVKASNSGYTLLPTSFTVTLPYTDKSGNDQLDLTYTVINNANFILPATGGKGFADLLFAGLVLLASTIVIYSKSQQRSLHS